MSTYRVTFTDGSFVIVFARCTWDAAVLTTAEQIHRGQSIVIASITCGEHNLLDTPTLLQFYPPKSGACYRLLHIGACAVVGWFVASLLFFLWKLLRTILAI